MRDSQVGALVIGAGIAGLAAAHALRDAGLDVCVLDSADRPGGVMRTDRLGGYLVERGPNTCTVKAPALGLLRRAGLEALLRPAEPAARLRFLFHDGRLEPLPGGVGSAVRTPLLSACGKARLLAEPFKRRGSARGESVDEFVSRRLGPEVSRRLVGPFLTGVYAGDERELGAEAVFPSLVELERAHGSIVRGALAGLRGPRAERGLRGIHSTAEGLGALATALAEGLGDAVQLGAAVRALEPTDRGWRVGAQGPGGTRTWDARRVVVATPAHEAAALVRAASPEAAAHLEAISYAPIVGVALGVDPQATRHPIEGFGFLVPRAAGLRLLGCLFMSRLFPGRAPEGRALLTCMLGGTRWREAVDAPDDTLEACLREDLERTLGLRDKAETLAVTRWARAVPQPGREHPRQVADLRRHIAGLRGLRLAGAYLDGVAVADALGSGLRAARELG